MATLVRNGGSGILPLPPQYGVKDLVPGQEVIINDTPANVAAAFGSVPAGWLSLTLVPDNQPGSITPSAGGFAGGFGYTPTTSTDWGTPPTTVGGALDSLAHVAGGGATDALPSTVRTGTATLGAGGTVTVSATITASSKIQVTRNTPGGTLGNLSAPSASRVVGAPGHFVINSDQALETSTVDWAVLG
jgi:hypothetical protein